jgi:TDG/mug DNA glycosylase family protein
MTRIVSPVRNTIALDQLPPLRDRIRLPVRVLFVGINPGVRSAQTGHHFAGYSNRFWKLLYDARIVPEPVTYEDDERLHEWGLGITNLIARATPGIDTLEPDEYVAGVGILRRKVRRWKPAVVAFVGVTVFRAAFACPAGTAVKIGLHRDRFEGARVVVLPNPSGRNAHFSYKKMVKAFRTLRRIVC